MSIRSSKTCWSKFVLQFDLFKEQKLIISSSFLNRNSIIWKHNLLQETTLCKLLYLVTTFSMILSEFPWTNFPLKFFFVVSQFSNCNSWRNGFLSSNYCRIDTIVSCRLSPNLAPTKNHITNTVGHVSLHSCDDSCYEAPY